MSRGALLMLFVACAALAVLAAPWAWGLPWLAWLFKPLATVCVIVHAAQRGEAGSAERRALLAGLVFSLLGDIALLWPERGFVPGLVAFLFAHLAYLWALTRRVRFAAWPPAFIGYAAVAGAILALLWRGVPAELRAPVVAYVACLASMAAQAAVAWWMQRGTAFAASARLAAIGGALFVFSDAMIAVDRFAQPLPAASLWILPAYWAAQWLIASMLPARATRS